MAERSVRELTDELERQKSLTATFQDALTKQRVASSAVTGDQMAPSVAPVLDSTSLVEKVLNQLLLELAESGPSPAVQNFCAEVMLQVVGRGCESGSLLRTARRKPLNFFVSRMEYSVAKEASSTTKRQYIRSLVAYVKQKLRAYPSQGTADPVSYFLKAFGRQVGYIMLRAEDHQLDVNQCVALRDHMQTSTNNLCRMQQGLKAFSPLLKILPT